MSADAIKAALERIDRRWPLLDAKTTRGIATVAYEAMRPVIEREVREQMHDRGVEASAYGDAFEVPRKQP